MPDYVVARVGEALNDAGKPIRGSKVLAVGVAYKGGVDDRRESPALAVMARLQDRGANVGFSDPFVEAVRLGDRTIASLPLDAATLRKQDCVLILTAHPGMDVRGLVAESPLVFDTRGVTTGVDDPRVRRL